MAIHVGPEVLQFWRQALLNNVLNDGPDLTSRQMVALLSVYLTDPPHTVRGLAKTLNVAKPVITRALNALEKLEFVRRKIDEADRRSVLVQRTVRGAVFLREFADQIEACELLVAAE